LEKDIGGNIVLLDTTATFTRAQNIVGRGQERDPLGITNIVTAPSFQINPCCGLVPSIAIVIHLTLKSYE